MKLLIIGHGRHGKDTVAEILNEQFGLKYKSSSYAAAWIFIYKALKPKYAYSTFEECYHDRHNHRAEWHDLISWYNRDDKAKLAKDILKDNNIYVGMRCSEEIAACKEQGLFDLIIGVYDPRQNKEGYDSFSINLWKESDIIIPNAGSVEELKDKTIKALANHVLLDTISDFMHKNHV